MKNLLLIAITILAVGCSGKDESTTETKTVEEKVVEVNEEAKTEEPVAETKSELNGVPEEKIELREGIWYLKGLDTPFTGKVFSLHENGQKKAEGNFKDGKLNGLQTTWYENGQKFRIGNFKDGKEDGLATAWHKNGQKAAEANAKDGKHDGLQLSWYENGQKRLEVNYKDGKEVAGSAKYWNIKGEPVDTLEEMALEVKEEVKSKEPVAEAKPELDGVNAEELDRRGKFPNFIYFSKGSDTPYTGKVYELHPNGQKGYEGKYKDGLQEGLIVMWYESGQKFREENYIDGEKEGLWGEWYPDGQKSWEASYKDGKVNGIWTRWHENGQKAIEENYKDDELISAKYWNTKGELKK